MDVVPENVDTCRLRHEDCVVVFSGGQDSTTCLAQAVRDYGRGRVACITFRYGQRHGQEVAVAQKIAADFGVAAHQHQIVDLVYAVGCDQ